MPDTEKVIKGLEICSAGEWNSTGGRDHTSCPYYPAGYTGCTCKLLMRDALALLKAQEPETSDAPKSDNNVGCWYDITHNYTLEQVVSALKAQEPRVMTLEEYEAWIDTPFTERNPVFHEERTKRGAVTCWVNTAVCTLREYGKNDRCWTSRPTDAQRMAVKWE